MEKNETLLLESEKRSIKDDVANKQMFIENLLNFNQSNILSHNNIPSSSIIQKKTKTGSNNTVLERKISIEVKMCYRVKHSIPELQYQFATENDVNKKEG